MKLHIYLEKGVFLLSRKKIVVITILLCIILIYINYLRFFHREENTMLDNKKLIFRLAESRCSEHPSTKATKKFVELVEERTNGEIEIIICDSSSLGNETNITEQIEFGGIDFARVSTLYMSNYIEEINILFLPNILKKRDDIHLLLNSEIGSLLTEKLKREKINLLAWYQGPLRGIYNNNGTISTLDEFKIGVPENEIKINELLALGVSPIPVKIDDIYNYIKSDYIQGAENDLLEYYYHNNYDVAKNFNFTPWSNVPEALIASNTAIKQLTPKQQKIIIEAAKESAEYEMEQIKKTEFEVIEELGKKGVNFVECENIKKYNEIFNELYIPFRDKYGDLLNEIARIGEENEK